MHFDCVRESPSLRRCELSPRTLRHFWPLSALLPLILLCLLPFQAQSGRGGAVFSGAGSIPGPKTLYSTSRIQDIPSDFLSGDSLASLSQVRDQRSGLCHHPASSSVPLWECSHNGPIATLAPATLHFADIPPSLTMSATEKNPPPLFPPLFTPTPFPHSPDRPPRFLFAFA